jgi:DNA-binding beta-propeller fold protein YncE
VAFRPKGFISVPAGARPGFDHADVYSGTRGESRLYVAHTGADRVDVIDCVSNTYLRALPDHPGVAGVFIDSEHDMLLTSDRGCARVSAYRCSDESLIGGVQVGPRPNGIAYDGSRRNVFAFNLGEPIGENCSASVASLGDMSLIETIQLPGRPRWAMYDRDRDRVYANIRQPAQIIVIDAGSLRIVDVFDVPSGGPHGLALVGNRLFCAADAGKLVVLDRETGRIIGSADLPGEPDVIMHDAESKRLFIAVGDPGVVVVVDDGTLRIIETVETEGSAHTIGWNADNKTLYAFLPVTSRAMALAE